MFKGVFTVLSLLLATTFTVPVQAQVAVPADSDEDTFQVGYAFYYADVHDGRRTSSGEIYRHDHLTAAHRTLPIGTRVRVENVSNGNSVVVRINDRGPYVEGRIMDVSGAAAKALDMPDHSYTMVRLVEVEPEVDVDTRAVTAIDEDKGKNIAKAAPEGTDYYTVQLGSYSDRQSAEELAENYDETWVQEIEVNSKTVFRVNFGVYSDRESAEKAQQRLTEAEGFVKQVDGKPPIERIRS